MLGHAFHDQDDQDETDLRRQTLREQIREQMIAGELEMEPELHVQSAKTQVSERSTSKAKKGWIREKTQSHEKDNTSRVRKGVEDDDFFNTVSDSGSDSEH